MPLNSPDGITLQWSAERGLLRLEKLVQTVFETELELLSSIMRCTFRTECRFHARCYA